MQLCGVVLYCSKKEKKTLHFGTKQYPCLIVPTCALFSAGKVRYHKYKFGVCISVSFFTFLDSSAREEGYGARGGPRG